MQVPHIGHFHDLHIDITSNTFLGSWTGCTYWRLVHSYTSCTGADCVCFQSDRRQTSKRVIKTSSEH